MAGPQRPPATELLPVRLATATMGDGGGARVRRFTCSPRRRGGVGQPSPPVQGVPPSQWSATWRSPARRPTPPASPHPLTPPRAPPQVLLDVHAVGPPGQATRAGEPHLLHPPADRQGHGAPGGAAAGGLGGLGGVMEGLERLEMLGAAAGHPPPPPPGRPAADGSPTCLHPPNVAHDAGGPARGRRCSHCGRGACSTQAQRAAQRAPWGPALQCGRAVPPEPHALGRDGTG